MAQYEDLFVVKIDMEPGKANGQNVYAYDYDGNLVWRISPPHLHTGSIAIKNQSSPYTGMTPDLESGPLMLCQPNGFGYFVDPKTGEVLETEFLK